FIANHRTVFAVNHEHGLLDLNAFNFVGKDWKRVETKLFELSKSMRVDNAWIPVGREIERLSRNDQGLFELREHYKTADRGFRCGHQQAVVAASFKADDR